MTRHRGQGEVRLPKGSAIWHIRYSFRGKRREESAHSAHRADAVRLLNKRLGEIGAGRLVGPDAERVTFADLARMIEDDYAVNKRRSGERLHASLKHLRAAFGEARALDITLDTLNAYVRNRMDAGAATSTIRNELNALKRAFSLAVRAGRLATRPPFPLLQLDNTRTGFFESAEFQAVVAELPAPVRPVVTFAALTGWRIPSEVLPLTWAQVDFAAGTVRLEAGTTKNGKPRTFPFRALPDLAALLDAQRAYVSQVERATGRVLPWVFVRPTGAPIRQFRDAWVAACQRAGLVGRLPHDLRRTAVRNLERAGVSRSVAMQLTGHLTESVYRRYAIVSESDLAEGVGKLARVNSAYSADSAGGVGRGAVVPITRKAGAL